MLIAATVLASGVASADANVIKVAIPAIGHSLHAGTGALEWTLTSYLLAVAALLLLSGSLSDRFGRRRLLATGLLVMLAASVFCALAPPVGTLIAARALQGVGAALVVPNSLALLNGTLRDGDRARGIGIWAGASRIGGVVVIALVPVLIGAVGGTSLTRALTHGYQPAMIIMGGLCVAAALITALFVTNGRTTGSQIVPRAPEGGCAVACPQPAAATTPPPAVSVTGGRS